MHACINIFQEFDKWSVDRKVYEGIMGDDTDLSDKTKSTSKSCNLQINTAATTKLEYTYFNALLNCEKSEGPQLSRRVIVSTPLASAFAKKISFTPSC